MGINDKIAFNLQEFMKKNNISANTIAKVGEVTPSTITRFLSREIKSLNIETIQKISYYYKEPMGSFIQELKDTSYNNAEIITGSDIAYISFYRDIGVSAGKGLDWDSDGQILSFPIPLSFLHSKGIAPENALIVKVNGDDYLKQEEFMIRADFPILPRSIVIYGKKHKQGENDKDNIYLNYWLEIFLKTIECGKMTNRLFKKSLSKNELAIGLPLTFRMNAFNCYTWGKEDIIKFLSCLFGIEIQESYFHQQIFLDYDLAA